jgi:hypothetical protein
MIEKDISAEAPVPASNVAIRRALQVVLAACVVLLATLGFGLWRHYDDRAESSRHGLEVVLDQATAKVATSIAGRILTPEALRPLVEGLELGGSGSAVLFSRQGRILYHPVEDVAVGGLSLADLALAEKDALWGSLAARARTAERGLIEGDDPGTRQRVWLAFRAVPGTDTILAIRAFSGIKVLGDDFDRHILIVMVALGVLLSGAIASLAFHADRGHDEGLVPVSIVLTCAIMLGTLAIWIMSVQAVPVLAESGTPIVDRAGLRNFMATDPYASGRITKQKAIFLPVGIHVQTMEYTGTNNVSVSGVVWQHLPDSLRGKVGTGIIFPESVATEMKEFYMRRAPGADVIGWWFKATLRQAFDYYQYPFDHQDVWIRMWPAQDFDKNVVLVPDMEAYSTLYPRALPGVDKSVVLNGWNLTESFFGYRPMAYDDSFGVPGYIGQQGFPELQFNVFMVRSFMGPIVSLLLPMTMVAILLFLNLKYVEVGNKPLDVLTPNAAFFFSVAIAHAKVRETFSTGDFLYMEVFCFVLYLMIGLVAVLSLMKANNHGWAFISHRDSLLPKAFYWPVTTGLVLLSTILVYY